MKKVLNLLRVSSRQQLKECDIPLQRKMCEEFIDSKKEEGWVLYEEQTEKAISAYKNKVSERDVLNLIAEKAERREFDILLVYMGDRIARNCYDGPSYLERLYCAGVQVWSVKEGCLDISTPDKRLLIFMKFWQAEGESRKTGIRVRDAQIDRIRAGKHIGGYAPYGYELVYSGEISNKGRLLKELVVKEPEAGVVRHMFDLAHDYGYGAFRIARDLNERGIIPQKASQWGAPAVMSILKNPIYKGYFAYDRRRNQKRQKSEAWIFSEKQNENLAIISEERWNQVQKLIQARTPKKDTAMAATTGRLLLTGMAVCGYCGTRLTNSSKYDYWTTKDGVRHQKITGIYRCTGKASGKDCEGRRVYMQKELEGAVISQAAIYMEGFEKSDLYQELLDAYEKEKKRHRKELEECLKKKERIERDIKTLEEQVPAALRGEFTLSFEKLCDMIRSQQDRRREQEEECQRLKKKNETENLALRKLGEIGKLMVDWREQFEQAPSAMKKMLLAKMIDCVEVYRDTIAIKLKLHMEDFFHGKIGGSDTTRYIPDLR